MKIIYLFLYLTISVLKVNAQNESYVQLKSGQKIMAKETKEGISRSVLGRPTVVADGTVYPISEVLGYCNGGIYYGNLKNQRFVERVISGRINYYKKYESGWRGQSGKEYRAIQKGDSSAIIKFSKKKLIEMLHDDEQALGELTKGKDKVRKNKRRFGVGLGVGIAGALTVLVGFPIDGIHPPDADINYVLLLAGGAVCAFGEAYAVMAVLNIDDITQQDVEKAIGTYNANVELRQLKQTE